MTLYIDYQSQSFPAAFKVGSGTLTTSWNDILWSAITIGRPSTYHVFRHGPASFHEAIFRLALIRMAVEQDAKGYLRRTDAFAALDPTEKGMVSYFLGMTLCKLFASRFLATPWLLHLDVFRPVLNPVTIGRSRPDLVGENASGKWHAFECKGRSSIPTSADKTKAKTQAQRLISVAGKSCSLHVGAFAFFRNDLLEFYWRDPKPNKHEPIALPRPEREWRYYYEPALSFASDSDIEPMTAERRLADVTIAIHPEVRQLLEVGRWFKAKQVAEQMRKAFHSEGYQPDGLKVAAGESWAKRFEPREADRG